MTISSRAVVVASVIGAVLQVGMIVAGHYNKSVQSFFPIGGMGFSLIAGLIYTLNARPAALGDALVGGLLAGAICAFIGILAGYLWKDVPATLLIFGTLSSAVTGAIGGWVGRFFTR